MITIPEILIMKAIRHHSVLFVYAGSFADIRHKSETCFGKYHLSWSLIKREDKWVRKCNIKTSH